MNQQLTHLSILLLLLILNSPLQAQVANVPPDELISQLHQKVKQIKLSPNLPTNFNNYKTEQALKQRLDSIVLTSESFFSLEDEFKELYTYNDQGNMLTYQLLLWDWNQDKFSPLYRFVYNYDETGTTIQNLEAHSTYYEVDPSTGEVLTNIWGTIYLDEKLNTLEEITYEYQKELGESVDYERSVYEYDEHDNNTQINHYYRDTLDTEWLISHKETYTYDEQHHKLTYQYEDWDTSTNRWELYSKYKYTNNYNEQEKLVEVLSYNWSEYFEEWELEDKISLQYNNQQLLTDSTTYYWGYFEEDWIISSQTSYTYNTLDSITQYINISLFDDDGNYLFGDKETYTYNEQGNRSSYSLFDWSSDEQQWAEEEKIAYTYTAAEQLATYITYSKNYFSETQALIPNEKISYTYNLMGNEATQIQADWDEDLNEWKNYRLKETNYDTDYTFNDLIWPTLYLNEMSIYAGPMITHINYKYWNSYNNSWEAGEVITHYYSQQDIFSNTSNATHINHSLSVFPNPSSDYIHIQLPITDQTATLELFDMQGRAVHAQVIRQGDAIAVHTLPTGIYSYQVQQGPQQFTGKLMVK